MNIITHIEAEIDGSNLIVSGLDQKGQPLMAKYIGDPTSMENMELVVTSLNNAAADRAIHLDRDKWQVVWYPRVGIN